MTKEQSRKPVVAVIAAYNEADRIGQTINAVKCLPDVVQVVVVDDGSTDGTEDVAESAGAQVVRFERNLGKGLALSRALSGLEAEVVLFLDGDLGDCAVSADQLIDAVARGEADCAVADFPKAAKKGGLGLVKGLARWGIARTTGVLVNEPLSGQRAVLLEALRQVKLERGFGIEVGMTIDLLKRGYRLVEVPVHMTHRETGRDLAGFWHRGRQFVDVGRVIFKRLF